MEVVSVDELVVVDLVSDDGDEVEVVSVDGLVGLVVVEELVLVVGEVVVEVISPVVLEVVELEVLVVEEDWVVLWLVGFGFGVVRR